ncbi:MAG TPA: hypothetical protein VE870_10675 [Bacteroidales bacterium]|nr:hypothetical protein [Bacteroidales bacterium]
MEFIRVKKHELERLAETMFARKGSQVAITPWRARSQASNPHARNDDVVMIYARDDNGYLAGFTGLLPGLLNGREDLPRIHWVSCWYADPAYRGGKVAVPFLNDSLEITGSRIIHTDINARTASYLERLGDFSIRKRDGVLLRLRSSLHTRAMYLKPVSARNRFLRTLAAAGILKLVDALINVSRKRGQGSFLLQQITGVSLHTFDFPSDDQLDYIRQKARREFIRPDRKLIEWWMAAGWVTKKEAGNASLETRYYFSAFAGDFHFTWLEVDGKEGRLGIALLNFRDGTVKTPYLWYEKEKEDAFFTSLYHFILSDKKNRVVLTFHEAFAAFIQKYSDTYLRAEPKTRYSAITTLLASAGGQDLRMQDGNGVNLFT